MRKKLLLLILLSAFVLALTGCSQSNLSIDDIQTNEDGTRVVTDSKGCTYSATYHFGDGIELTPSENNTCD